MSRTRILVSLTRGQEALPLTSRWESANAYLSRHLLNIANRAMGDGNEILARSSLLLYSDYFRKETTLIDFDYSVASLKLEWSSSEKIIALKYVNHLLLSKDLPLNSLKIFNLKRGSSDSDSASDTSCMQ